MKWISQVNEIQLSSYLNMNNGLTISLKILPWAKYNVDQKNPRHSE